MADGNEPNDQSVNTDDLVGAILSKITPELDKRFQGFQGILDRRDGEYRNMLEDIKTADLSPEEREQVQASKLAAELEESKRRVQILEMRKDYPEEVDLLDSLLKGESLEQQLTLLSEFRKVKTTEEPQNEGGDNEEQPTPVDRNNPARKRQLSIADAATKMDKDLADNILSTHGSDGGILRRLRRQG